MVSANGEAGLQVGICVEKHEAFAVAGTVVQNSEKMARLKWMTLDNDLICVEGTLFRCPTVHIRGSFKHI